MMKKGFTLAEVLITLAIIGVVATMVLPGVLTNTAEQQAKTGVKKAIYVLTNIAKMNEAMEGYDFAGTTKDDNDDSAESVYGIIARRGDVDWAKTEDGTKSTISTESNNYVMFFRDGSSISFERTVLGTGDNAKPQADGLPLGFGVVYDMNGDKAPNILSNCDKNTATENDQDNGTCNKASRVIKDRFALRIRGQVVEPNGSAARWAADREANSNTPAGSGS